MQDEKEINEQGQDQEESKEEIKKIEKITDLIPDSLNANRHTQRGMGMLEDSIRKCGFGDSLTVDKNGKIISGNGRTEQLVDVGMLDAIVVQSDGTRPIIHQRVDLDLDEEDSKARRLAVLSNRTAEINLEWDASALLELSESGVELEQFWRPTELAALARDLGRETDLQAFNASGDKAYMTAHKAISKANEVVTGHLALDKGTATRCLPELLELRDNINNLMGEIPDEGLDENKHEKQLPEDDPFSDD